jgi:hypothetical protein
VLAYGRSLVGALGERMRGRGLLGMLCAHMHGRGMGTGA